MAESVMLIIVLLAIGFIATRLSALLKVPHSVFLVLMGVAGGIILRYYDVSHPHMNLEAFPEIVLFVLLPPLIFESAYHINIQDLKRDIVPISTLAVVALLISTAFIGVGVTLLLKIPLSCSLLFGALISATDPVAVVALFRQIGAPRRLSTLVEGESLINDGTAIVLFRLLLSFVTAASMPGNIVITGAIQFFSVVLGGIIIGLVFIVAVSLLLRLTTDSAGAQLGFTVAAAYGSFIVADHWFHASGVIATLTVGLYLGNRARIELNREALNGMQGIWEFLALCANILVFLAVGLSVNLETLRQGLGYIPLTLMLVYLARAVSVLVTIQPLKWLKLGNPVRLSYQAVMIWGGLRGGLALALVLILPHDFPYRNGFVAMTTAVVLAWLIINALTTEPLMKYLKLTKLNEYERIFYSNSVAKILSDAYEALSQVSRSGSLSPHLLSKLRVQSLSTLEMEKRSSPDSPASISFDIQSLLYTEQEYYHRQLEEEIISRPAYVTLTDLVSQRIERFREEGLEGLRTFSLDIKPGENWLQKMLMVEARLPYLAVELETLLHLDFGLNLAETGLPEGSAAREVALLWINDARKKLDEFYKTFPHMGMAVQSEFIARRVDMSTRHALEDMRGSGIISDSVYVKALSHISDIYKSLMKESRRMMNPTFRDLLSQIPLFSSLPEEALTKIEQKAGHHRFPAGTVVVSEGSEAESIFIVLSGILEAQSSSAIFRESRTRMLAGSFFGEISLLLGRARSATVTAIADSELVEIGRDLFAELAAEYPQIDIEVQRIARKRIQKDLFTRQEEKESIPLDSTEIYEMLASVPVLSELSPATLVALQRRASRRKVVAGEVVANKNDRCIALILILSGILEIEGTPFVSYTEHMRLQRGDWFGEDSLLLGSEIQATVRACTDAEILEIGSCIFEQILRELPKEQVKIRMLREKRLDTVE